MGQFIIRPEFILFHDFSIFIVLIINFFKLEKIILIIRQLEQLYLSNICLPCHIEYQNV